MSTDPSSTPPARDKRWRVTACLGILSVICVILIASAYPSTRTPDYMRGTFTILGSYLALEVFAVTALGIWILPSPKPGDHRVGSVLGKAALFIGLGFASVIFLFGTCYFVLA